MWDDVDADVVCRQMGFATGTATLLPQDPVFTRMFYDVSCMGHETEIQSCHSYDYDVSLICSMFEDAGVSCSGMPSGKIVKIDRNRKVLRSVDKKVTRNMKLEIKEMICFHQDMYFMVARFLKLSRDLN